jgi:hypothetical protein
MAEADSCGCIKRSRYRQRCESNKIRAEHYRYASSLVARGGKAVPYRGPRPANFLLYPDCTARIPAIPLLPAYLRSFAGVSIRRLPCPTTRTSPPRDSSSASPI